MLIAVNNSSLKFHKHIFDDFYHKLITYFIIYFIELIYFLFSFFKQRISTGSNGGTHSLRMQTFIKQNSCENTWLGVL